MKKSILFLVLFISFFLLPSIVHALSLRNIIPLDIISNFFKNILGISATDNNVATTTATLRIHQYTYYNWRITAQELASYTDALQMHYDAISSSDPRMEAVHALRPDYIGLLYRNVHKIYNNAPEVQTFLNNGWILKYTDGSTVYSNYGTFGSTSGGLIVDIGNPDYQQWLANWLLNQINTHGWNGVFADDGFGVYRGEIWWDTDYPNNIVNPRTHAVWTEQEIRDAWVSLYNKIRSVLGNNAPIIVNGIFNSGRWSDTSGFRAGYQYILDRTSINGFMGEGWLHEWTDTSWMSETTWKQTVNDTIDIENNFIRGSSSKMFIPICYIDVDGTDSSLPSGATVTQMARYCYASTLLGASSNQIYLGFSNDATRLATWYNTLFSLNIGTPQDSYSMISGTHVYQRTFSNVLVLVNPTFSSYQITLSKSYKNLDGNVVSGTYIMNPHTGEILLSTSSPPVTTTTIPTITTTIISSTTTSYSTTTISSSTTIPPSQYLVGYWKFDEGSGTTASDSSVYGNVGSLFNNPTWTTGKIGNALNFNGVNSYVDVGSSGTLNPTSAISVSAWIYTKSITTYPRIVSKETNSVSNPYALELINSTDIRFFIGDGMTETGTPDINVNLLNSWVYVVGTYDGQYIKIYINGQLKGQTALISSIPSRTTRVLIGNNPTNTRQFNGIIDEVKIWSRALSASEVLGEYGGTPVTSACDSACKTQSYASGICRTSNTLSAPTQFSLISNPRDTSTSDNNVFHTHNNLITMFKTLYDKYPGYASYEPIGKTYEGRDIVLFKIGNPNGGKVLWDGALHGWEDAGSEVEYLIAKWLLENGTTGKDPRAQRIVQNNLILFIPVVNMDSYERQNRDFKDCQYGVDLNRNFVNGWTQTPCGDYPNCYNGNRAASEPETQALRNAFNTYKPKFYLNGHYGGGPLLYYYSGSGSNMTLTNSILQRISQLDSQAGVKSYPTSPVGAGGETVGDASQYSNAWLLEVAGTDGKSCSCYSHTCQTYNDIVNTYYPKVLPILLAMTEASEIPTTSSTSSCQSGETFIGQDGCSSGQTCCCGFPSTSTTTTIPSGFTGTNFICNYVQTNNLWECSLDYTNNLGDKGLVKFYFIDSVSGEVKSTGSIWTNTGSSGTIGSELSCYDYHGTYNVVWRAYRSSDTAHSNPVAFSTTFKSVTC